MNAIGRLIVLAVGAVSAMGCETAVAPTPAVLEAADDDTMTAVTTTLASAMERASVGLGPGDPTTDSVISVLPPPPGPDEDRSLATPTYFDLVLVGGDCFVVHRDTGAQYLLDGVSCRPL